MLNLARCCVDWGASVKKMVWNEKARSFVKQLDDKTKKEIGTLLMILQKGIQLGPPQSKSIKIFTIRPLS